jgi:hypothetical protein
VANTIQQQPLPYSFRPSELSCAESASQLYALVDRKMTQDGFLTEPRETPQVFCRPAASEVQGSVDKAPKYQPQEAILKKTRTVSVGRDQGEVQAMS